MSMLPPSPDNTLCNECPVPRHRWSCVLCLPTNIWTVLHSLQTMPWQAVSIHYSHPLRSPGGLSLRIIRRRRNAGSRDLHAVSSDRCGFQKRSMSTLPPPWEDPTLWGLPDERCVSELIQRTIFFRMHKSVTFLSDGGTLYSIWHHSDCFSCVSVRGQWRAHSHCSEDRVLLSTLLTSQVLSEGPPSPLWASLLRIRPF